MSQAYDQSQEPVSWDRVEWRQGDGRYTFQLASGGLLATLTAPHGAKLTLPMVAWEGLLDALAAQRKTRTRTESKFPARSGARWYDGETGDLAAAFKAGRSIRQLAGAHSRSEQAVEAELARQGLWDRVERRPLQPGEPPPAAEDGADDVIPAKAGIHATIRDRPAGAVDARLRGHDEAPPFPFPADRD
jgi:hypothetical protein